MPKKSSFWSDFQAFIMRGNVVDLAVAVIIGGAFGQIVNSLVQDIITPAILQPALNAANLDTLSELSFNGIKYGLFLSAVINFLVIAFAIFLMIRALEKVQRRLTRAKAMEELDAPPPEPDPTVVAQEKLTAALERLANLMEERQP
ncbi:large conductance mechanosensitive channel protein MscL [Synechococcus moorigangaii CMS01]|nr:large conductance mechanosensitive channel protein MscL [Synechococcus moorigangaii CMS01]